MLTRMYFTSFIFDLYLEPTILHLVGFTGDIFKLSPLENG